MVSLPQAASNLGIGCAFSLPFKLVSLCAFAGMDCGNSEISTFTVSDTLSGKTCCLQQPSTELHDVGALNFKMELVFSLWMMMPKFW
jgi:hypothetical protein